MPERTRQKLIAEEAIDRLLQATRGARHEVRDRAIIELLYGAGLRVAELCSLDIDQVDLDELQVTVIGKRRKKRTVPIGTQAADALQRYLGERTEGPLFLSAWKMRVTARTVQRTLDKYAASADIGPISPHTLRHSMASHMLRRGAYAFKVREQLGHASLKTTAGYLHSIRHEATLDEVHREFHPRG